MEWVETTAKSIEEAREQALDRLGVGEDEAEFEILDSPKPGLFGRMRGEARVRARVRPTAVRPKQDRRSRGRKPKAESTDNGVDAAPAADEVAGEVAGDAADDQSSAAQKNGKRQSGQRQSNSRDRDQQRRDRTKMDTDTSEPQPSIDPEQVGAAAVEFMTGLANAFGTPATATLSTEGTELEVRVDGNELGLLIGPGGRTLLAVQDLARVASQRRLGDHDTRLRIDISGYRERRRAALEKFATAVADEVLSNGRSKALEPMPSADRKVIHDVIQGIDGVTSHSDGEEPRRRVVIAPT